MYNNERNNEITLTDLDIQKHFFLYLFEVVFVFYMYSFKILKERSVNEGQKRDSCEI